MKGFYTGARGRQPASAGVAADKPDRLPGEGAEAK